MCPAVIASVLLVTAPAASSPQTVAPAATSRAPVAIPFELTSRLIIVPVSVNGSRPLSFVLDTGIDAAIVALARARELRLALFGKVTLGGIGAGSTPGSFVRGATWTMPGLDGLAQRVSLALDLAWCDSLVGRAVDGVVGGRFIREFVVELDYQARRIVLHDRATFRYAGPGEAVPLQFTAGNHPLVKATVTPIGGAPIDGTFVFDVGSSLALALRSPFVERHALPRAGTSTIRAIGLEGLGGKAAGRFGKVAELRIGSFAITEPIALFSADAAGALANPGEDGDIGAQIAGRFRIFLDYVGRRMILEPSPAFVGTVDRAESGLALRAYGDDFRTFRIVDLLEASPATDAGLEVGDVIVAVDGQPGATLTLSALNELFERAGTYALTIRRGDRTLRVTLSPRRML